MNRIRLVLPPALAIAVAGLAAGALVLDSTEQEYEASATILQSPEHGPELCLGGVATSLPPQCDGPPISNWDWDTVAGEEHRSGTTWVTAHVRRTYDDGVFTLIGKPGPFQRRDGELVRFDPLCDEPEVVDPDDGDAEWEEATQVDGGDMSKVPGLVAIWVTDPRGHEDDNAFIGNAVVRPGYEEQAIAHIRRYWGGALCVVERDQRSAEELERDYARIHSVFPRLLTASVDYNRGVIEVQLIASTRRRVRTLRMPSVKVWLS